MITKFLSKGLSVAALGMGLGLAAISATPANAHDSHSHRNLNARGHDALHLEFRYGHKPRHKVRHRVCTPRKAIRKAERKGLYRVRVKHTGRRFVVVKGRSYHGKVRMAFHRDSRKCRIAWVQHGSRRGHGRTHDYRY